jgi:hypothetical protein
MTYQGARAPDAANDIERVFEISKARIDSHGHVTRVLWGEVNAASNLGVGRPVTAPVAEVVDALHAGHRVLARFGGAQPLLPERAFVVVDHADGHETLALAGAAVAGREITDIAALDS